MLIHLLILFLLVASCVMIHGLGMLIGLKQIMKSWPPPRCASYLPRMFWILIRVVFGLLVLHLLQITVWAVFFHMGHYFPNFETAFYYSATSYSTAGYGDVIPPESWRVFGAIEAVTGILMFGWSTGVLFSIVHRLHTNLFHFPDGAHTTAADPVP
jgi:hypothetical protein